MKKLALAYEHRDFFQKNRWIEFDSVLEKDEFNLYKRAVRSQISKKLSIPDQKIEALPFETIYMNGRDIWREESAVKKVEAHPQFAKIISELTLHRGGIRLGFDQLLMSGSAVFSPSNQTVTIERFESLSLNEIFPVQGLVAGVFLSLSSSPIVKDEVLVEEGGEPTEKPLCCPFPKSEGGVLIADPSIPLDWKKLGELAPSEVMLILYTSQNAVYISQEKDPLTYFLKAKGFVFGDKLSDKYHPILLR